MIKDLLGKNNLISPKSRAVQIKKPYRNKALGINNDF